MTAGSPPILYLDTSALYKLVIAEAESRALRHFLRTWPLRATSELARTELMRAVRRATGATSPAETRARQLLERVDLLPISTPILELAGTLRPAMLRSLDAIHLASALALGNALAGIVTYDERLAGAAHAAALAVHAPQ